MFFLENNYLIVEIATKGAELQRIYHKQTKLEYLWNADPAFWAKKSPVLFPIVGGLKDNRYQYQGKQYSMGRHGFARDKEFCLYAQTENSVSLVLKDDEQSLTIYPFHFALILTYTLADNELTVNYEVQNTSTDKMWFSIGAHPAFRVPLTDDTLYEDYYIGFKEFENTGKYPLNEQGLLKQDPEIFLQNEEHLALKKALFYQDALVFKTLASKEVSILSEKTEHKITVSFEDFPYLGIWGAKDADFVCIEPWHGIADSENSSGQLTKKEGILSLDAGADFSASWSAKFF